MATVEIQETDTNVFGSSLSGYVGSGWGNSSNSAFSGGASMRTNHQGDSVTFNLPACTACYLVHDLGLTTGGNGGCLFGVTVDGVPQKGYWSMLSNSNSMGYRVITCLFRKRSYKSRTVVLTNLTANGWMSLDSVVTCDDRTKPTMQTGVWVPVGDSVTAKVGATTGDASYVDRCTYLMQVGYGREIQTINNALGGERWVGLDSTRPGGLYRLLQDVIPNAPEFVSLNLGINDIVAGGNWLPVEVGRHLVTGLALLEDSLNVEQMGIAVCTPPSVSEYVSGTSMPNARAGHPQVNYRLYVDDVPGLVPPWAVTAFVHEATASDPVTLYPNAANAGNTDFGTHLSDAGHGKAAVEVYRAFRTAKAA